MGRLYSSLLALLVVFSAAMSFVALGVYASQWWWSVVGIGILVVFIAVGGLLVPAAQKELGPRDRKTASAAHQAFGAFCVAELLTMGLVTWTIGNRSLSDNDAYQALGLVIFLGLLGVGIQGALGTLSRLLHVRNRARVEGGEAAPTSAIPS